MWCFLQEEGCVPDSGAAGIDPDGGVGQGLATPR